MGLNITVASKFNPFTYDDYIKPYKENIDTYFKNYRDTENKLSDLGTQLEALDYIIESEPEDSPLKSTYSNYKKELEKAAEALATGWNQADVQNYNKLKKAFAKDISPIATQYARRQKLEDEQRKVKESKPSTYFSKRAAETSLAEMIDNPNWSYTSFVGDDITKAVQSMVSPVATILNDIWKDGKVGDYDKILSKYGISPEDVSAYFRGEYTGGLAKFFDDARTTAIKSYGIDTWNDQNALNTAYQYANIGIPKAIGKLTPQLVAPRKGDKGGGSNGGNNPSGIYPGTAVDFTTSRIYMSPDKKAKEEQKNYIGTITGGSINKSAEELALEGQIRDKGLSIDKIDSYLSYLQELAAANSADAKQNIGRRPGTLSTYEVDKVKKKYPEFEGIVIAKMEIEKYQKAVQRRKDVLNRYSVKDNSNIGIYGGTSVEDARTGALLEEKQATDEIFIGNPLWEDKTNQQVLTSLNHDYHNMSKSKDGNGLYEIDLTTGATKYVKEDDAKNILDPSAGAFISYAGKYGMLINKDGKFYQLKGSGITGAAEDSVQIRNSLRDFSPETIKTYTETIKKKEGNATDLATTDRYYSGEELQKYFTQLKQSNRLVQDPYNSNNLYCYLRLKTKDKDGKTYTDTIKVLYDRSGVVLGTTSLNSELGSLGTPMSEVYTQNHLNSEAWGRANATINTNTSTAPRAKKANPQLG